MSLACFTGYNRDKKKIFSEIFSYFSKCHSKKRNWKQVTESWITYERALLKISFTNKELAKVDVFVKHKMVNACKCIAFPLTTDYN